MAWLHHLAHERAQKYLSTKRPPADESSTEGR